MKDKNNIEIQIGDIVKIENSPIKSNNTIYVVAQDGTSETYSGKDLTLYKVAKHKKGYTLSKSTYNVCFYPLWNASNKYKYTKKEMSMATIEVLIKCNDKAFKIVKSDNQYELEEKQNNNYFFALLKSGDKTIEDVSYSCNQSEKLIAFFSNITLKCDESIEIVKQSNNWDCCYGYRKVSYELIKDSCENKNKTEDLTGIHITYETNYIYGITEDIDTRDNSKIWVVKVKESLSREEYKDLKKVMGDIGGYYSRFKQGFIFKENPTELLYGEKNRITDDNQGSKQKEQSPKDNSSIEFDIMEDKSPSGKIIYLVKVKNELSKEEFSRVKRRFAKIQGYHSSLKNGFIFKYDPREKIIL